MPLGLRLENCPTKELVEHLREEMRQGKYVGVIIGLIDGDQTIVQSFGEAAKGSGRAPDELIGLAWHRTEGFENRSHYGTISRFLGFLMDGSRGVVVLANMKYGVIELGNRLVASGRTCGAGQ